MGLLGLFNNKESKKETQVKFSGTFSKPRATKKRVAWDYTTPYGRKATWYQSKSSYLMDGNKKFWKD